MSKFKDLFDKAFAVNSEEESIINNEQSQKNKPNTFSSQNNSNKRNSSVRTMNSINNEQNKNTNQKKPSVIKMQNNSMGKVHTFEPASINDATRAIEYLNSGYAVLVNLENSDNALSQRIVDIITGALYLLDGDYSIVTEDIYLFAPKGVEISSPLEAEHAKDEKVESNANKSSFKFKK